MFVESMAALPKAQAYWVALSGGLDSMVLAHMASLSFTNVRLLHINHGLSPNAHTWQQHVQTWANMRSLACTCISVQVDTQAASLEAAARSARHAAFAATLSPGEAILCAHHRDDQAETVLLRLLRGSGLKGLAAMVPARPLGAGMLLRPLLGISRAELELYAQENELPWVEDESNQHERFDRNWLRHSLIPQLATRWPAAKEQLALTAARLHQEQTLLETYLAADLACGSPRKERLGHSLLITVLNSGTQERRRSLLRFWFGQLGLLMPSHAVLSQMEQLIESRIDSEAMVTWGPWQLRRFAGRVYVLPQLPSTPRTWQSNWNTQTSLTMLNGSHISAKTCEQGLPPGEYCLRLREGGERSHPAARAHSQTLKKLLQEVALEPWLRELIPLVYRQGKLVAVGDLWIEKGVGVAGGIELQWRF